MFPYKVNPNVVPEEHELWPRKEGPCPPRGIPERILIHHHQVPHLTQTWISFLSRARSESQLPPPVHGCSYDGETILIHPALCLLAFHSHSSPLLSSFLFSFQAKFLTQDQINGKTLVCFTLQRDDENYSRC